MTPCDALRQMMVSTDTEQECADAIGEFEHWSLSPKQRIDRMRQCLSHELKVEPDAVRDRAVRRA